MIVKQGRNPSYAVAMLRLCGTGAAFPPVYSRETTDI